MPEIEPRKFRPQQFWLPPSAKLEYHPAAEGYPLLPEDDLDLIVQDMIAYGFNPHHPIVLQGGKILDGRNRYLAAQKARVEFLTVTVPDTLDPQEYVQQANEHRRHLTPEWLRDKRAERIAQVARLRSEGKSIRAIAEATGVSKSQTERDLEDATVPGGTVEPLENKVTGRDGRTIDTTNIGKPAESRFCERCRRVGPVKGCLACDLIRKTPKPSREPGDDTESEEAEKAQEKALPKNGAEVLDWRDFHSHVGALVRSMTAFFAHHNKKDGPEHRDCQNRLAGTIGAFKGAFLLITRQKPPEH